MGWTVCDHLVRVKVSEVFRVSTLELVKFDSSRMKRHLTSEALTQNAQQSFEENQVTVLRAFENL